jgi:hypothetical protein
LATKIYPYRKVAASLQAESNVFMEDSAVNEFRDKVLTGNYTNLNEYIRKLDSSAEHIREIEY